MVRMKKAVAAVLKTLAAAGLVGTAALLLLWAGWPLLEDAATDVLSTVKYTVYVNAHEDELLEAVRQTEAGELARSTGFDFVYQQGDVTKFGLFSYSAELRGISATDTHGIYYSPQDQPLPATDGHGIFRTRRLKRNWFFYEEHF